MRHLLGEVMATATLLSIRVLSEAQGAYGNVLAMEARGCPRAEQIGIKAQAAGVRITVESCW